MIGLIEGEDGKLIGALLALTWANLIIDHNFNVVPNFISGVFEAQDTLRDMGNLIAIVDNSECIGNELSHKSCEFIIAHSGLSQSVKAFHILVCVLQKSCSHHRKCST